MSRTDRQILINLHTSGTTAPAGKLNLGEIAVQHDSTSGASLWIETVANSNSENTLVRFMNASAVTALVESARTDLQTEINAINDAVGLPHSAGTFSGGVVWDAIEQIYDELVASAAAATTYVVPGESEDTEKYLKITDALDDETSARTYTISLSGISNDIEAVDAKVNELSGVVEDLSTFVEDLDFSGVSVTKKPVVNVEQENGLVSAEQGSINAEFVDVADADDHFTATTVEDVLTEIAEKIEANEIKNTDGSINVTTAATGTVIDVNIKANDTILAKDGGNGVYSTLNLVKITTGLPETVKERYELQGIGGTKIGDDIDVPKDSHIVRINYISDPSDKHYQNLEYVYIDASGNTQTTYVDMSELVIEAEFASGVTVTSGIVHGDVDVLTEKDSSNNPFLTVGADGFKVDGIKNEIEHQISLLDFSGDTAVSGKYIAAIEETDGVVAVKTRADVSKAPLNDYVKGIDASAVAATDTINEAVSKLENQIDAAKDAATTKVVEGVENAHMEITSAQSQTDSSMTYTITLTDVASESALTAEIAARKAVDGQSGDTYVADADAKYISGATSLSDADSKLSDAVEALEDALNDLDYNDSAETGQYVTKVDETNGVISVARANISEAPLNGYTKGADATAVAATDSINEAVSKLENQIDVTESALTAEIAARKAVDGQSGNTYVANETAKYISSATSLNDADILLNNAITAITKSAVTAAEFGPVDDKDETVYGSNAGIEVVDGAESKKIVLDLSLLKIDCGEY